MKTLFMVEDEELIRELFSEFVQTLPDINYLGSSADGREAIARCLQLRPDILILDLRLPEIDGMEMLYLLKRKLPATKYIVFTGAYTLEMLGQALRGGVDAFTEKAGGMAELANAIQSIGKGQRYFSPTLTPSLQKLTKEDSPDISLNGKKFNDFSY